MSKRQKGPGKETTYSKVETIRRRGDTPLRGEREQAAQVPPHALRSRPRPASAARSVSPPRAIGTPQVPIDVPDAVAVSVARRTLAGSFHHESVHIFLPYKYGRKPGMFVIGVLDNAVRLPLDLAIHGRRMAVRGRDSYRQVPVPLAVVDKTLQELFRRFRGASVRPAEPVSEEIVITRPPLGIARSAVGAEPLEDGFLLAEKSCGRVVAVSEENGTFTADIDELDSSGASVRVDLPLDGVLPGDIDLVRAGATFDISIGTAASPVAIKTHFHRLRTTPESIEAGRRLADTLPERFDVSELRPRDGEATPETAVSTGSPVRSR